MNNFKYYVVGLFLFALSTVVNAQTTIDLSNSIREISPLMLSSTSSLRLDQVNTRNLGVYFNTMNQEENFGKKKKVTGIVMTVLGVGLLASGIGLVSTADGLSFSFSVGSGGSSSSGDLGGALGILAVPASAGLLIPGLHKWVKGGRMYKKAKINGEFIEKDNSEKFFNKLWHLNTTAVVSLGDELKAVYGPGLSLNTGLGFGLFKNRIKLGPCIDYQRNKKIILPSYNREKSRVFMGGLAIGYLQKLNKSKTIYFYPGVSIYGASVKNFLSDSKGNKNTIFKGSGVAKELKVNFVLKSFLVGVSITHLQPKVSFSKEFKDDIEEINELYDIVNVKADNYKFNFNSIKFSIGILI